MPQSALCSLPSALAIGVCAAGVLGGCDVTIKDGDIKNVSIRATATQEWKREYPLAEGGRVEIVNSHGSISATAGPAGTVGIVAVIEAQAMTDDLARAVINGVSLEEAIQPEHVRVAVAGPRNRGGFDVNFKVTLPADARLDMNGNNGTLKADGLSGHVKAMVVNGGIELTAMRGTVDAAGVNASVSAKMGDVTGPLRLESTNGRISLELPKTAKATLNARSVNGNITVTGLTVEESSGRRIRTLESQLNGGGPEIDLRVTNGRIAIEGK
jgi:hypothetical protein